MRALIIVSILISASIAGAQPQNISNFIVKEHLLKNGKIAIIATDSLERPLEAINGSFAFNINGFKQDLKFNDGIAVAPQPIEKSAFVYLKHQNEYGSRFKLYYVLKKDDSLNPIKISWMLLLAVPLVLISIAALFRKFIIFGLIILIGFFFFNSSNGLGVSTVFETIIEGLKGLF